MKDKPVRYHPVMMGDRCLEHPYEVGDIVIVERTPLRNDSFDGEAIIEEIHPRYGWLIGKGISQDGSNIIKSKVTMVHYLRR